MITLLPTKLLLFAPDGLSNFTANVYRTMEEHAVYLPTRFSFVFSYMKTENWLLNYRNKSGIEKSLRGLVRRAAYISDSETAYKLFLEHYDQLKDFAAAFIPDVKGFAKQRLDILL